MISVAATEPADGELRECRDCGLMTRLPAGRPNYDARCPRCGRVLRRWRAEPLRRTLACVGAAICFYIVAVTAPFLTVESLGRFRQSTLLTGPEVLERHGMWELGAVVVLTSILLPLVNLGLLLTVLVGLRLPRPPRWLYRPFLWFERLSPWAMVDVYLIGLFVAYTRLIGIVHVEIGNAVYALVGLMIAAVAAEAALDSDAVWDALERRGITAAAAGRRVGLLRKDVPARLIGCAGCRKVSEARPGEPCPRCGSALHIRHRHSLDASWALIAAAAILYLPANAYPVMRILNLGSTQPYTILGGVEELFGAGLWPLAAVVFTASIAVPLLKLGGLALMLIATHRRSAWRLTDRARLYRLVATIGRWSMIDVFMVSILVALVRFGMLVQVTAGLGAVFFAAVVILTMLAAERFDPRLMWDAAADETPAERAPGRGIPGRKPA